MHEPAARMVIVAPLVPPLLHTPGVVVENVTGFPEAPPVAATTNGVSPYVLFASAPKLMVWLSLLMLKAIDVAVVSAGPGVGDEATNV